MLLFNILYIYKRKNFKNGVNFMKMNTSKSSGGPSSAIGIMKFNEQLPGPKLSPELVVGVVIAFIIVILIL